MPTPSWRPVRSRAAHLGYFRSEAPCDPSRPEPGSFLARWAAFCFDRFLPYVVLSPSSCSRSWSLAYHQHPADLYEPSSQALTEFIIKARQIQLPGTQPIDSTVSPSCILVHRLDPSRAESLAFSLAELVNDPSRLQHGKPEFEADENCLEEFGHRAEKTAFESYVRRCADLSTHPRVKNALGRGYFSAPRYLDPRSEAYVHRAMKAGLPSLVLYPYRKLYLSADLRLSGSTFHADAYRPLLDLVNPFLVAGLPYPAIVTPYELSLRGIDPGQAKTLASSLAGFLRRPASLTPEPDRTNPAGIQIASEAVAH